MTSRTLPSNELATWVLMVEDFDDFSRGLRVRLPRSIARELIAARVAVEDEVRPGSQTRPTTRPPHQPAG